MNSAFDILLSKLNSFIKKYYKNQIIKGSLIGISLVLLLFLTAILFEYFSWSNTTIRTIVFYSFIAFVSVITIYYIIIPTLKIVKLGKVISHKDAAGIIGNHFPEVSDKLLNTLQLHNNSEKQSMELLLASIDQKSKELTPVPFKKAVNYNTNLKYLKYAIPPVLIVIIILLISPSYVYEPTQRIINHSTGYVKPLPYSFELLNKNFSCAQHNNYTIKLNVIGEEVPSKIWISESGFSFRMIETKPGSYEYTFKDVLSDIYFKIVTNDFTSDIYHIKVYPQPVIFNFDVNLSYPSYLQKQNETIENTGDLVVPEGTKMQWKIYTRDTRNVSFIVFDSTILLKGESSNVFKFDLYAKQDFNYQLTAENDHMVSNDTMTFNVQVVKDEFPFIVVNEYRDDHNFGTINFSGTISDDHGFYSLSFYYRKDSISEGKWQKEILLIDKNITKQYFDFLLLSSDYNLFPGDAISYYFEIRDNDAFNGYKRSKSEMYYFKLPDASEIEKKIENASSEMKSKLNETLKDINRLEKQTEETKLNLFEKKELSWSDKKQLEDLLNKEENLKNKLEEIQKLNDEIKELQSLLKNKLTPDLMEKLKQLEELFNELFNEELEKELEKLKDDLEKDKVNDFLEKMKQQNEDLKSDLEQNLELFKQLEFEKMIQESIEDLKKLAEEEKKLSEQTANKENSKEENLKKQDSIQKEFSDLMEKLNNAEKLNKELEDPFNMKIDTAAANEINEEMDEAEQNLQKNKKNKASENQNNAGQKMQDMADGLDIMMNAAMEEKMGEDIEQIKNMLDNLLDLSFAQEILISEVSRTTKNDPKNVDIRDNQKGLKDDFDIIHDSLIAMSKRQVSIKPFIIKESGKINNHIDKALKNIQEQNMGKASKEQQYAMTSMNNLSLMLAESMEQMKQSMQMSGNKKGNKKCKNPGKGKKPSMSEIMKQQQGLSQGMQGKMKKSGKDGKDGINKRSEELARMAATQGEIRRMLQEFIEQLEAEGGNGNALNRIVEEMKKTEDDVINRRLTQETIERQKRIETRMLKSQKALQEREKEKKRESKEGKNRKSGNQNKKIEYKPTNENQEEILITLPIEVRPYYKKLLKEYLYKLEKDKYNEDGK